MSETSRGGAAVLMLRAQLAGQEFPPPDVEDTPRNREVWDSIAADIAAMPDGVMPDVPADYTEQPPD